jgi:hypothetical protein
MTIPAFIVKVDKKLRQLYIAIQIAQQLTFFS